MSFYIGVKAFNRSAQVRLEAASILGAPEGLTGTAEENTDSTLDPGTYEYVVTAISAGGESGPSTAASVVVAADEEVALVWNEVDDAVGYRVYRDSDGFVETADAEFTDDGSAAFVSPGTNPPSGTVTAKVKALPKDTLLIDIENGAARKALAHHSAFGQYGVVAVGSEYRDADGSLQDLPANS